jgi:hypothetical protein
VGNKLARVVVVVVVTMELGRRVCMVVLRGAGAFAMSL